jgi:hypothetical protein
MGSTGIWGGLTMILLLLVTDPPLCADAGTTGVAGTAGAGWGAATQPANMVPTSIEINRFFILTSMESLHKWIDILIP